MKTAVKQSIDHSIREDFKAYPDWYPLSGYGPSEDAASSIVNWVENNFENSEESEETTLSEWFEVAVDAYLDYFSDDLEEEELGENRAYIESLIKDYRIK